MGRRRLGLLGLPLRQRWASEPTLCADVWRMTPDACRTTPGRVTPDFWRTTPFPGTDCLRSTLLSMFLFPLCAYGDTVGDGERDLLARLMVSASLFTLAVMTMRLWHLGDSFDGRAECLRCTWWSMELRRTTSGKSRCVCPRCIAPAVSEVSARSGDCGRL